MMMEKTTIISIGYAGENDARHVDIDISELRALVPDGIAVVTAQRHGETGFYPAAQTEDLGDVVRWTFTAYDAAIVGYGKAQVEMLDVNANVLGKSHVMMTRVGVSLEGSEDVPEWFESYEQRIINLAARAESAADNAVASADDAQVSEDAAAESAASAEQARVSATASAESAAMDAATAESAANAADAAMQSAIGAAGYAGQTRDQIQQTVSDFNQTVAAAHNSIHAQTQDELLAIQEKVNEQLARIPEVTDLSAKVDKAIPVTLTYNGTYIYNGSARVGYTDIKRIVDDGKHVVLRDNQNNVYQLIYDKTTAPGAMLDFAVANGKHVMGVQIEKTGDTIRPYSVTLADESLANYGYWAYEYAEQLDEEKAGKDEVDAVEQRVTELESRPVVDKNLTRRVANLEAAAKGNLYREETDSEAAHIKTVPPDAMPWALLDTIGGHSEVIGGEMMSFSPDTIVSRGANLYDEKKYPRTTGGVRWNNGQNYTSAVSLKTPYIPISDYRGMVLSYNSATFSDVGGCAFYDDKQNYITGFSATAGSVKTVTVPENASFMRFTQNVSSDSNVMLCVGDSLPDYRPYRDPIITDLSALVTKYFPDGMHSAGDVHDSFEVDDDGKVWAVQRVNELTLNGSENGWSKSASFVNCYYIIGNGNIPGSPFNNFILEQDTMNIISDRYIRAVNTIDYSQNTGKMFVDYTIGFNYGSNVTIDEWKAHLQNNPLTVCYELANPIRTEVTEDFQTALNVEADGSLTFTNDHGDDYRVPLPNQETYLIKLPSGAAQSLVATADANGIVTLSLV